MVRKLNGDLHYIINGLDQGVAASNVPELFWGVVDLYGRTVKVNAYVNSVGILIVIKYLYYYFMINFSRLRLLIKMNAKKRI